MPEPSVSVVIPNWNGAKHLPVCLSALRAQTHGNFEVVLVDNGSSDDSVAIARSGFPEARVIELDKNYGFSRAVNQGIRAARGGVIALLNNDTEAAPEWLAAGMAALERNERAGLIACRVMYMDRRGVIDSAGDDYTPWGAVFNRGHLEPFSDSFSTEQNIFGICGSAAFIRKAVFDDIGLFDENFFAYYEDLDINLRARLRGWDCVYAPDAVVYHGYSASTHGARLKRGREEVYIHLTAVWLKNMPAALMLHHLLPAAAFHSMIFYLFISARLRNNAAMPRVPFFNLMADMLRQRPGVMKNKKTTNMELDQVFLKRTFLEFIRYEIVEKKRNSSRGR